MKTTDFIIFTLDLLMALYASFTNDTIENVVDLEELDIPKDNQHTENWKPYVGIGMMVIGGAFLMLGAKKSLTT